MTNKQHQVKAGPPGTIELNDAALDRVAAGGELLFHPLPSPVRIVPGDGSVRSLKDTI